MVRLVPFHRPSLGLLIDPAIAGSLGTKKIHMNGPSVFKMGLNPMGLGTVLSLYASVGGNPRMPREAISGKVVINRTGPGPVRAQYSPPPRHRVGPGPRFFDSMGFVRAPQDVQESSETEGIFAL